MNNLTIITGAQGAGKTTKLHEQLQKRKGEKISDFSAHEFFSKKPKNLSKVVAIEDVYTSEQLKEIAGTAAKSKSHFYITTTLDVKETFSKEELDNFEIIEAAITLP